MLFQGQEFGSNRPFFYFADPGDDIAPKVREGRDYFLTQFASLQDDDAREAVARPSARETFERSKLDWSDVDANAATLRLHRDLLALRRTEIAFASAVGVDGAVIDNDAFLLRFFADRPEDERLMIVNLGRDHSVYRLADPLAAPPAGLEWQLKWSSEDAAYNGEGRRPVDMMAPWSLSSDTALVFATGPARPYTFFGREEGEDRQRHLIY